MGTLGNSIRSLIRGLIANSSIRSSLTLTPITRAAGSSGGYSSVSETNGTARTIYAIPSEYVADKVEMLKFGDLKVGDARVLVRDDETIDTDDEVTFDGSNYDIRTISPIFFNDVTIAKELVLSERI